MLKRCLAALLLTLAACHGDESEYEAAAERCVDTINMYRATLGPPPTPAGTTPRAAATTRPPATARPASPTAPSASAKSAPRTSAPAGPPQPSR